MANRYPILEALTQAVHLGSTQIEEVPKGWRVRDHGWPEGWVRDPLSGVNMSAAKFAELTGERNAYAAELRRGQLVAARGAVKDNEAEERSKRAALKALIADLVTAFDQEPGRLPELAFRVAGEAQALLTVRAALAGQRFAIKELNDAA